MNWLPLRLYGQKSGNQFIFVTGMLYSGASFDMMRPASQKEAGQ
ncbi:hypothetical protein [Citrobacter sedlakii]